MEGLKTETEVIDGRKYRTTQLPVRRSLRLFTQLMKLAAPALEHAKGLSLTSDVDLLAPAVAAVMSGLDDKTVDKLLVDILVCTDVQIENSMISLESGAKIDLAFNGQLTALFKVVAFSLKANYGDFWQGVLKSLGQLAKKTEETPEALK